MSNQSLRSHKSKMITNRKAIKNLMLLEKRWLAMLKKNREDIAGKLEKVSAWLLSAFIKRNKEKREKNKKSKNIITLNLI